MRRDAGKLVALAILAVAALGLVAHALLYPFISDDAYISFRYAHNLAYHNELTFNVGERVEGYTNFLWTVILGLLLKLRLRPDVMARMLGAGFGVAVLVLTYVLTRLYRGGRADPWDSLGAVALASTAGFALWCSGGLETQMFTALMLGGMTLYFAERAGCVRWRLSGLVLALSAMTRPEGLMVFGLTGLHLVVSNLVGQRRLRPRLAELWWLLGFLVPFGLFFLWRHSYYGYPFPNTYYVKAGGAASASALKWGVPYLWDFVRDNKLYLLAPLLLLLLVLRPRTAWSRDGAPTATGARSAGSLSWSAGRARGTQTARPAFLWSYLGLVGVVYAAYVVLVGGDFMALGRFFVPVAPILALLLQESLREAVQRWPFGPDPPTPPASSWRATGACQRNAPRQPGGGHRRAGWRPLRFGAVVALLTGLLVANSVGRYGDNQKLAYYRWGLDTIAYLRKFADDRILIGRWMRRNLPRDTFLAVGGAGAIVYASRLRSLDTFGLNDLWIAHNMPRTGDRPGHTKSAPEHYILQQKPDLMCHQAKHQDWPYRPPAHEAQYWRSRGYGWVCIAPEGLRPSHYCCLKRLSRDLGPWPAETGP